MALHPSTESSTPNRTVGPVTYYDSAPEDPRRPLLLLHGTGGSAQASFWALFPMLATRRRVVALDFVDAVDAVDAAEPEIGPYVDQVDDVAHAVAPDGVVDLLGYSFGAVIAAAVAARAAERVRSLTLVAGWLTTDAHQRVRNELWQRLHDDRHPALAPFQLLMTFSPRHVNGLGPDELNRAIETLRDGPDRSAKMRFNRSVDISEEASRIVAPTLVVGCREDQTAPLRHSHLLFGAIADARLAELDSGHGVVWERPAELFSLVDRFVDDPFGAPAGAVLDNAHA